MARRRAECGFSIVEAVVVVLIIFLVIVLSLPLMAPRRNGGARQLKDATHLRYIGDSMTTSARNNRGVFPLPSVIDGENATVADPGTAKDTTANILSTLIWNGFIRPELCLSPAEVNPAIVDDEDYQHDLPTAAVDPSKAAWDPAFAADFTGGRVGNTSYALLQPTDARMNRWMNTPDPLYPIIASRAPQITAVVRDTKGATSVKTTPVSNSLLIHGGPKTWEGNVAHADGSVRFETSLVPQGSRTYTAADGKAWTDVMFFDEEDDSDGSNAYLGIFTTAGGTPGEFRRIWD